MEGVGELGRDGEDDVVGGLPVSCQLGDAVDPPDPGPPAGADVSDPVGPQRDLADDHPDRHEQHEGEDVLAVGDLERPVRPGVEEVERHGRDDGDEVTGTTAADDRAEQHE